MPLSDDEKINQIILSLREYDFGDIKKVRETNANIATFILCGCFIDHVSRYRYYNLKTDTARFENFTDNYLPSFIGNGKTLYLRLRSSLVHNYSVKGHYLLCWGEPSMHLTKSPNGRIYLDIDCFMAELEQALNTYTAELKADPAIRNLALSHYAAYPIMAQLQ